MGQSGAWSVLLAFGMVLLSCLPAELSSLLQFEKDLFREGEYYRLLTGHFVHLGWIHALLNSAALIMIVWIFPRSFTIRAGLGAIVFCALYISFGLLALTEVAWYRGFSGILHGLFVVGVLRAEQDIRWRLALMLGLLGKLVYELCAGPDSFTAALIGGAVIESAHWLGAIGGVIVALTLPPVGRQRPEPIKELLEANKHVQ